MNDFVAYGLRGAPSGFSFTGDNSARERGVDPIPPAGACGIARSATRLRFLTH